VPAYRDTKILRPLTDVRCHASSDSTAVLAAASAAGQLVSSASQGDLAEGALVEYQRDTRRGLALLVGRDGKRNWTALDTRSVSSLPEAHHACLSLLDFPAADAFPATQDVHSREVASHSSHRQSSHCTCCSAGE
jgi:hypothetical protein